MDWLMPLLTDTDSIGHILLVYSVVIAVGMALGRIKVFGISLGVTFVLFVALAVSYAGITVNGTVLNFLRDFGLILFVFFIGLQVGPSFFSSFKSGGLQLNLLTLLAVGLSILVTIALFLVLQGTVTLPQILGVHYGAVTNTPGLGATQEALDMLGYKGENIAIAYACAYPLGVVGIITSAVILRKMFRINLKEEERHWDKEASANSDAPIFFHYLHDSFGQPDASRNGHCALFGERRLERGRSICQRLHRWQRLALCGAWPGYHGRSAHHYGGCRSHQVQDELPPHRRTAGGCDD